MQRRLSTANFCALVGGGLVLFCMAIFLSGVHIKGREAAPSVAVDDIPVIPEVSAEDEAAMAEAAGIASEPARPDDGGAVAEFTPEEAATATAAVPSTVPDGWKDKLLFRPSAIAAGSLEAQNYKITISGVEPLAPDEKCTGADGQQWFCGAAARTQFRNFLRGRALTCTVPETAPDEVIDTTCSVGGEDIGGWLVARGWARATDGGRFAEASGQAQADRLGIYGDKPALPALVVGEEASDPLAPTPSIMTAPALDGQSPSMTTMPQGGFPPPPAVPGH